VNDSKAHADDIMHAIRTEQNGCIVQAYICIYRAYRYMRPRFGMVRMIRSIDSEGRDRDSL